jgi:hypothetical protein
MCHLHFDFAGTVVMPGFGVCLSLWFALQQFATNKQLAFLPACPAECRVCIVFFIVLLPCKVTRDYSFARDICSMNVA